MRDPERLLDDPDAPEEVRTLLRHAEPPPRLPRHVRRGVGTGLAAWVAKKATAAALGTKVAAAALVVGGGSAVGIELMTVDDPGPARSGTAVTSRDDPGRTTRGSDPAPRQAAGRGPVSAEKGASPHERHSAAGSRKGSTGGPAATGTHDDGGASANATRTAPTAKPVRNIDEAGPDEASTATEGPGREADDAARLLREARLLERARRALDGDPAEALRRARIHSRRFPGGQLAAERELIAVDALCRLGRMRAARRRARAWLAAHPDDMYARRMRRIVASPRR